MNKKMEVLQSFLEKAIVRVLVLITVLVAFSQASSTYLGAVSFKDLSRSIEDYCQKNESLEFTDGFVLAMATYDESLNEVFLVISSHKQKMLEFNRGPYIIVDVSSAKNISENIQIGEIVDITGKIKMITKERAKELEEKLLKGDKLGQIEEKEFRTYYNIIGLMVGSGIISPTENPEKVYYLEASKIEINGHD